MILALAHAQLLATQADEQQMLDALHGLPRHHYAAGTTAELRALYRAGLADAVRHRAGCGRLLAKLPAANDDRSAA